MISARLTGVDDILARLEAFNSSLYKQTVDAYNASTLDAVTFSKTLTPVKTGYLRSRTKPDIPKLTKLIVLTSFSNDTPYGPFVCFGTRYMKARDFINPARMYGAQKLLERLGKIKLG